MCTAATREKNVYNRNVYSRYGEKERKSTNKSTGNDYAVAASLAVKVVPLLYGPFLRDTVVLRLRNASTYKFRAEIERNEFTTILDAVAWSL